jgi:hypothetical protein
MVFGGGPKIDLVRLETPSLSRDRPQDSDGSQAPRFGLVASVAEFAR